MTRLESYLVKENEDGRGIDHILDQIRASLRAVPKEDRRALWMHWRKWFGMTDRLDHYYTPPRAFYQLGLDTASGLKFSREIMSNSDPIAMDGGLIDWALNRRLIGGG